MSERMALPAELQVGDLGETETSANFQRITWAKCIKLYQDLGTDLLTFARDSNRNEYGLGVGLQVKSSKDKYSTAPDLDATGDAGWWHYEEDHKHVDLWVSHGFPHLLILTDVTNRRSFWQVVNGSTVIATQGLGYKIFVPFKNLVDLENADRLFQVAAERAASKFDLQGSIWDGRSDIEPSSRVRHSLLTPRLVAPHPNRLPATLEPDEALALLSDVRLSEFDQYPSLPGLSPSRGPGARSFAWRLVHSFHELLAGDSSNLEGLIGSKLRRSSNYEAAARIILATNCVGNGEFEAASEWLAVENPDAFSALDRAWLNACRIFTREISLDQASVESMAREILVETAKEQRDVTSVPLRAAAIWALYRAAGQVGPLEELVKAADNVVNWWRSRTLAAGLDAYVLESFRTWSEDTAIRWSSTVPVNEVLAARWNSGFCADSGAWRRASRTYGILILQESKGHTAARVAGALSSLRLANQAEEVRLGASRIWREGPLPALSGAVQELKIGEGLRLTKADLHLLAVAGDFLDEDQSSTAARSCSEFLCSVETSLESQADARLSTKVLATVLMSSPTDVQVEVASKVVTALQSDNQELKLAALKLLDVELWSRPVAEVLHKQVVDMHETLDSILRWNLVRAAETDVRMSDILISAAMGGDQLALGHAFDVAGDNPAVASAFLGRALATFEADKKMIWQGQYGMGGPDSAADLFWAILKTEDWGAPLSALLDFIVDTKVAWSRKRRALWQFSNRFEVLPEVVKDRVVSLIPLLFSDPQSSLPGEQSARGPLLALSLVARRPISESLSLVVELLQGDYRSRRDLATAIKFAPRDSVDVDGLLMSLITDVSARVRGIATQELAHRLYALPAGAIGASESTLRSIYRELFINEPGAHVPLNLANSMRELHAFNDSDDPVQAFLINHPSGRVRRVVRSTDANL